MKRVILVLLGLNLCFVLAALGQDAAVVGREGLLLNLGGDIYIAPDEQVETVVAIGGDVTIEGRATESVVVIGGRAVISGRVDGDVVAVGGRINLRSGAVVGGDVVSIGRKVIVSPGAVIGGEVTEVRWGRVGGLLSGLALGTNWIGFWAGLLLSLVFGGLLTHFAPRQMEAIASAIPSAPGWVLLWGGVALVLFLPLILLSALTIIGIPFIPILILAYIVAGFLGLVGCSLLLGDKLAELLRFRTKTLPGSLVTGLVVLALVRLIPFIGGLVSFGIVLLGLGAVIVTRSALAGPFLEEQPVLGVLLLLEADEAVAPLEPLAVDLHDDLVLLPLDGLEPAVVPALDLPRSILALGDDPLKLSVLQRMVFNFHGQPSLAGLLRWPLGDGPALQDAFVLQPEIVMEATCVVFLDHIDWLIF